MARLASEECSSPTTKVVYWQRSETASSRQTRRCSMWKRRKSVICLGLNCTGSKEVVAERLWSEVEGRGARAVSDIRKSAQDDLNAQRWGMAVAAVGFDTETRPKFTKGGSAHKVALVQIATYEHAWLFRCCKIGIPNALQELLEDLNP